MAVIKDGRTSGSVYQGVEATNAAFVTLLPGTIGASGGRYRMTARTGLATVLSAHTSSAGHFAQFRWGSTTKSAIIERIEIDAAMITDFTTLQRFALAAFFARAFTAAGSGGAALTLTTNNGKLRTSHATTALSEFRVATTADLTAGTHTLDANPFLVAESGQPSDGATVGNNRLGAVFDAKVNGPIVLAQDEGLVFSNLVLMGAAGTAGIAVTVDWREVLNAEVPTI